MQSKPRPGAMKGLRIAVLMAAGTMVAAANVPTGWYLAGSKPADYESGITSDATHNGHPTAYLKAKKAEVDGFGTLMQNFRADQYRGRRLRLSASVKAENVQQWAGLWMRVEKAAGGAPLAFDNMYDRPIKGTADWRNYDVVLDVPQDATGIFFGVLLTGSGKVWLSGMRFETVGPDVPTTGKPLQQAIPDAPANLDFQN
jgi:hypothetical protein